MASTLAALLLGLLTIGSSLRQTAAAAPRNATIMFDGTQFVPSEIEIDAGGFLTVTTPEGEGSCASLVQQVLSAACRINEHVWPCIYRVCS